jgi:hypothetical protein
MDLWIRIQNTVSIGNIGAVVTIILFIIYSYYRIRRYLAQQHAEFIAYLQTLTVEQTARIEACIHRLPDHPENPAIVDNPDNGPKVP